MRTPQTESNSQQDFIYFDTLCRLKDYLKCVINLFNKKAIYRELELAFLKAIIKRFPCLELETINSKANFFSDLIMELKPFFIIFIDYKELKKRMFYVVTARLNRNKSYKKRLAGSMEEEKFVRALIEHYIEKYINHITSESVPCMTLNYLQKVTPKKDYLNLNYSSLNVGRVFGFDTTSRENDSFYTFLLDLPTRLLCTYLITESEPNAEQLRDWILDYFLGTNNHLVIVHGDSSRSNSSFMLRKALLDHNILMSFCSRCKPANNHVLERHNRTFWYEVEKIISKDFGNLSLKNMGISDKFVIVNKFMHNYNTRISKANNYQNRYSPIEIYWALRNTQLDPIFMFSNQCMNNRKFIMAWHNLAILRLNSFYKYWQYNKLRDIPLILPKEMLSPIIFNELISIKKIMELKTSLLNVLSLIDSLKNLKTFEQRLEKVRNFYSNIDLIGYSSDEKKIISYIMENNNLSCINWSILLNKLDSIEREISNLKRFNNFVVKED